MKIYIYKTTFSITGITGMGPVAWDRDAQKMSMHPPLPGHIEYVAEEMHRCEHHHYIVRRHNPDNDYNNFYIENLPTKYLKRLLSGKVYLKNAPVDNHHAQSLSAKALDH